MPQSTNNQSFYDQQKLFLVDLLDTDKIKKNTFREDITLEVPSALVTMIWSAYGGNSNLFDFIYAHLRGIKYNEVHLKSNHPKIKEIILATDSELYEKAKMAYGKFFVSFAPLIEGAIKHSDSQLDSQKDSDNAPQKRPIRKYEPYYKASDAELEKLRDSYTSKFNLQANPIYDLYFLQIYHAQKIGFAASPFTYRDLLTLGRKSAEVITELLGASEIIDKNSADAARYKEFFDVCVQRFVSDEFKAAALGVGIELALSFISPIQPNLGSSFLVTTIGTIIRIPHTPEAKKLLTPLERTLLTIAIMAFLFICFSVIYIRPVMGFLFQRTATPNPTAAIDTFPISSPSPMVILPSPVETLIPSVTPSATPDYVIPLPTATHDGVNYCRYVIQPNDTLQSVTTRFQVTENDLRSWNGSIAQGIFIVNQLIVLNVPCCRPIGDRGFSYTVDFGDTSYSIAKRFSITTDVLVYANNLFDVRYIQAGQMLCIPYP